MIEKRYYSNYGDRWDDKIYFEKVTYYLKAEDVILDIGAGRGQNPYTNFKGLCKKVYGLDPDPEILRNPYLDEAKIGVGEKIPYPSGYFDIVISANTMEHVSNPDYIFSEVCRVLKKGGLFIIKTSNKYHYVSIAARFTPTVMHKLWNKLRGIDEKDTFKKFYRANDLYTLKKLAKHNLLKTLEMNLYEGRPEYVRIFFPLYLLGFLYERIVNRFKVFKIFRSVIIGVFQKV